MQFPSINGQQLQIIFSVFRSHCFHLANRDAGRFHPRHAREKKHDRLKRETKKHIERPSSHIREHSWAGKNLAINIRYTQTSNRGAVTSRKIFFSFLKDSQYLRLIAENLRRIFSNIFRTELRTLKFFYSYRYSTNSDIFLSSRILSRINFIKNRFYIYIRQFE